MIEQSKKQLLLTAVCMILFFSFIVFVDNLIPDKPKRVIIVEEKIAEGKPKIHQIAVSYHVHFDTAYTGAVNYFPYKGTKDFSMSEKTFSMHGLSALYEGVFEFQRMDGENCKLIVNLQADRENALIRLKDGVFVMDVSILKKDDNHFVIFVAPNKKEVDSMMGAYSLTT